MRTSTICRRCHRIRRVDAARLCTPCKELLHPPEFATVTIETPAPPAEVEEISEDRPTLPVPVLDMLSIDDDSPADSVEPGLVALFVGMRPSDEPVTDELC